jgi:two-component system LytT family response regulator
MIKSLIIDDEPVVRRALIRLLQQHCPDVLVAGEAGSVATGHEAILRLRPDLVFLDIRMDDGTGFDLLEKFDKIDFHLIFVTAYEEYAVKAFRFSAVDYLLKPLDSGELVAAVDRVRNFLDAAQDLRVRTLLGNMKESGRQDRKIVLRTQEMFHFVKVSEIICCESDGNYTTFTLASGSRLLISRPLKEFEEILTEYGYFRPHKSFLINLAFVTGYEKGEGGFIILQDDIHIPIASRKRDEFLKLVEEM